MRVRKCPSQQSYSPTSLNNNKPPAKSQGFSIKEQPLETPPIKRIRQIVQAASLLFFLYLFYRTAYPLTSRIPVDLFLRIDPFGGASAIRVDRTEEERRASGSYITEEKRRLREVDEEEKEDFEER